MIDKDTFKKTEGRLYRYYNYLKLIDKLKYKTVTLYKQIESIDYDLRTTNIRIDPVESRSIDYSKERVTSSGGGISYAESEIMKAIDKLEKEHIYKKKKLLKTNARIREIEEEIADMKYNLSSLSEESKRFIEWKYGENKSIEFIAKEMYQEARSTAYRRREEIIEEIAQFSRLVT